MNSVTGNGFEKVIQYDTFCFVILFFYDLVVADMMGFSGFNLFLAIVPMFGMYGYV